MYAGYERALLEQGFIGFGRYRWEEAGVGIEFVYRAGRLGVFIPIPGSISPANQAHIFLLIS